LFTVEAYPDETFTGAVTQVRQAPQSVQNVITYDAVVGVPNPKLLLKPGMTAAVRVVTAERTDVLRVPNQALRFMPPRAKGATVRDAKKEDRAQHAVYRLDDGQPVRVPIEVGSARHVFRSRRRFVTAGDTIVLGVAGAAPTGTATGGRPVGRTPRLPRF
jgi:HlyD family secretion protein